MNRFSSLGGMAVVVTLTLVVFSGLVAADPPLPPSTGDASESWTDAPAIQSCTAGMNEMGDELQYCEDLQVHRKTKQIVKCESTGETGSFENPNPWAGEGQSHNCWNFNSNWKQETRTYLVCGDGVDGEEQGVQVPNDISTPEITDEQIKNMDNTETTDISEDWACPGVKPLSMRHDKGNLDPTFSLSGAGYADLDSLHFEAGSNMSFRQTVVIPACVNRVPMTQLDIELEDGGGDTVSEKTSISASHMNMYYGPAGDNRGAVREVSLPEQTAFKRTYDPEATLKSYRMWAWRQRFAGALEETVSEKDLELPENVDVSELADEYEDTGVSVGELWLGSDFLFGAEAPDASGEPETVTREIQGQCTVNVDDFAQFDSISDVQNNVSETPEAAKNLFGKGDGNNYCDLGPNETLAEITAVEDSGAFEEDTSEEEGTVTTTIFDNETYTDEATINVTDVGDTEIENASEFMDTYNNDMDEAVTFVRENKDRLGFDHIDQSMVTELVSASEQNDDDVSLEVEVERWPTGDEVADRDTDTLFTALDDAYLDTEGYPDDGSISPASTFDDRMITSVESAESVDDAFEVNLTLSTTEVVRDNYMAYMDIVTVLEDTKRSTWNWRALQEVSMTDLARCLYNWEDCMNNARPLDENNWDGSPTDAEGEEINDAGFGPRPGTWLYDWSANATENATDELQENYDVSVSTEFNKYYDGAAGEQTTDPMDVHVYRPCEADEGWVNEETDATLYEDNQFLCPDSVGETTASVSLSTSTVLDDSTSEDVTVEIESDDRVGGFTAELDLENPDGATITDVSFSHGSATTDVTYNDEDTEVTLEASGLSVPAGSSETYATVTIENDEEGPVDVGYDASVQDVDGNDVAVDLVDEAVTETAYYCDSWASNLPSYAEEADPGDYQMIDGQYYVCRDEGTVSTWEQDDRAPTITCEDCINPSEAPLGTEITIDMDVQRQGTPIDRTAVCWDENCEEIIFEGTSGSFTVDEPTDTTVWAQVEDLQGNVNTVELGSLRAARAVGESCEADEECLSGNCQDFECVENVEPDVEIE